LITLLYSHIFPFKVISIGSYTPPHMSPSVFKASPEVILSKCFK